MNNLINNSDVPPDAHALVPPTAFSSITGAAGLEVALAKATFYAASSSAASSQKAMKSDFRQFEQSCAGRFDRQVGDQPHRPRPLASIGCIFRQDLGRGGVGRIYLRLTRPAAMRPHSKR